MSGSSEKPGDEYQVDEDLAHLNAEELVLAEQQMAWDLERNEIAHEHWTRLHHAVTLAAGIAHHYPAGANAQLVKESFALADQIMAKGQADLAASQEAFEAANPRPEPEPADE